MNYHQIAVNIAKKGIYTLFLFLITNNVIGKPFSFNYTGKGEEALFKLQSLLYFEGFIEYSEIDFSDVHLNQKYYHEDHRFERLLKEVESLEKWVQSTENYGQIARLNKLHARLKNDLKILSMVRIDESQFDYILDYAVSDRKSAYYSLKLDWMIDGFHKGMVTESSLLLFFQVTINFINHFYQSGLVNTLRKKRQTDNHQLIAKMLFFFSERDPISDDQEIIEQLYLCSRKGNLSVNRHMLLAENAHSRVIKELLVRIEPLEKELYAAEEMRSISEIYSERNDLRRKYYTLVNSSSIKKKSIKKGSKSPGKLDIFFFEGKDYTYQYISYPNGNFQLLKHDQKKLNEELVYLANLLESALVSFSGERKSILNIQVIAQELYQSLIKPLDLVKANEITIIPDGKLCLLPFSMLMDNDQQFLSENYQINYQFEPNKDECLLAEEVINVSGEFEGYMKLAKSVFYKESNSIEEFKKRADNTTVLHLETHQLLKEGEPFLLMSNSDSLFQKDWYYFPDVLGIVLGVCAGFRGVTYSGEHSHSFGARAYENGAENVISSLWSTDDHATNIIFKEFFEQLKQGKLSSESLHQASKRYLDEADEFHRHPVFWASYVHYGGNYTIKRNEMKPWFVLLIFLSIVLVINSKMKIVFTLHPNS